MKSFKTLLVAFSLASSIAACGATARAQVSEAPPIRVKVKVPKPERFKGEVLHADSVSMMVRDRKDPRFVRTFTYSPKVQQQMEKIIARGGYQYGDKVEIRYQAGQDVALAIKGRPSKPI